MSKPKTLQTLIKVHQSQVDEIRRRLSFHQAEHDRIDALYRGVKISIQQEKFVPIDTPEMAKTLALFMDESYKKLDIYHGERAKVADVMAEIREELFDAFSELKRLEIALETHVVQEAEEEKKREQKIFDEQAIQGFQMKNKK